MQNFNFILIACTMALGALSLASCQTSASSINQQPDAVFKNLPKPDDATAVQGSVLKNGLKIFWRSLSEKKIGTVPIDPIPLQAVTRDSLDALDNKANHVIRLGHSSHLLKLQDKYWLIDPVFSERASPVQWAGPKRFHPSPINLEQLPLIEGVILSHDHYDHLDRHATEFLAKTVRHYVVPLKVGERLVDMGVPKERITELGWWGSAAVSDIKLTAAPAQHFSGRTLTDRNKTLWASWVIESAGQHIFYSGDGGYFSGFKEIGKRFPNIDLALIENGAYDAQWPDVHMTPEQSVDAFLDLKAKVLYPVHNSTFDLAFHQWRDPLERIAKLSKERGISLATPIIGEPMTLGQARINKEWWLGLK
jgi:L-ascorbate metabolism protein UlaG (beta-lactamase superfamily)